MPTNPAGPDLGSRTLKRSRTAAPSAISIHAVLRCDRIASRLPLRPWVAMAHLLWRQLRATPPAWRCHEVAKQVNPPVDDNGATATKQFYDMQDATARTAAEENAMTGAALAEGAAFKNQSGRSQQQKRDLLAFASTAAKRQRLFELPADELAAAGKSRSFI